MNKAVLLPEEKYKRMMEQLNRKENSHLQKSPTEGKTEASKSTTSTPNVDKDDMYIINVLPERFQKKAKRIIQFIKTSGGNILDWNENGEMIYRNQTIHKTHMADLISDAISERKYPPFGVDIFYKALAEMHFPEILLGSQTRRRKVRELREVRSIVDSNNGEKHQHKENKNWIKY